MAIHFFGYTNFWLVKLAKISLANATFPKLGLSRVFGISRAFTFVSRVSCALVGDEGRGRGRGLNLNAVTQLVDYCLLGHTCVCECAYVRVYVWCSRDYVEMCCVCLLFPCFLFTCLAVSYFALSCLVLFVLFSFLLLLLLLALHLDVLLCFFGLV